MMQNTQKYLKNRGTEVWKLLNNQHSRYGPRRVRQSAWHKENAIISSKQACAPRQMLVSSRFLRLCRSTSPSSPLHCQQYIVVLHSELTRRVV